MSTHTVAFDLAANSVDAVQRAAYRFTDRVSCDVIVGDAVVEVIVSPLEEDADMTALVGELRNEVLDQSPQGGDPADRDPWRWRATALAPVGARSLHQAVERQRRADRMIRIAHRS